jgi:aldehyde:ferredoxin oxidoreductase
MEIRARIERFLSRLHDQPQFPNQGAVLLVDLERQESRRGYLPIEFLRNFLGGRGANMAILYNLLVDGLSPLDPGVPLIFGVGPLVGGFSGSTRGNFSGISPDSRAILDANGGDYFPGWVKGHGYDHIVLYGRAAQWSLLRIAYDEVTFHDATPYRGLDNLDTCAAVERDFGCTERRDMALARITSAGENLVLSAGIMGGIKAIWARGGGGAKMGSMQLKGILVQGRPRPARWASNVSSANKAFAAEVLSASVIKNALSKVGTPFLYKPSRVLGALVTKNGQQTDWVDSLDADNFDVYRPGMDGCFKCPVRCRNGNDMRPEGKSGWGANALAGLAGNASYDKSQADVVHKREKSWKGAKGDGVFDRYDHGDGPEYVTLGKFGPNIGIVDPEWVLRFNNICNDLGLDTSSLGGALGWALELYQRGIITQEDTGGLELTWGNAPVIEQLLFMTARREGFGDVLADGARAVERGKYPAEALDYCMTVKGLFQSDPHDSRILKAFALGLATATRGMDHLRSRATLEINARINDDPALKTSLYGGVVSPEPTSYDGKEHAVRRTENTFAVGDSLGVCRFQTKLFNSPNTPGYERFGEMLEAAIGQAFSPEELDAIGRNICGIERLLNHRIGLRAKDDTLPRRWFEESASAGPFKGEKIDREKFAELKSRFYEVTGLDSEGAPKPDWHANLAKVITGFTVHVSLPRALPGVGSQDLVVDEPVRTVTELRATIARRWPETADFLADSMVNVAVNGEMLLAGEHSAALRSGDQVAMVPIFAGG